MDYVNNILDTKGEKRYELNRSITKMEQSY
jgi:hypothetical protein